MSATIPNGFTSTSSTPTTSPSASGFGGGGGGGGGGGNNNGGLSSSLYLFTFLITIVVLGLISAALLFRAYYIRRRFQQRVEDAIRAGQPLPQDAAMALGLIRPRVKQEKKVGPMPSIWETEMLLDRGAAQTIEKEWEIEEVEDVGGHRGVGQRKRWDDFTPLAVTHIKPSSGSETSSEPEYIILPPRPRRFLPSWVPQTNPLPRPAPKRSDTAATIPRLAPAYAIPPVGEEVTVGVLIALPFEEKIDNLWVKPNTGDGEEADMDVPEVCLGVISARTQ